MKILKLNNAIMLCPGKDETAINGAITIDLEGVEEGATVTVRKNGKRETETKHIVKDKTIVLHVEEAKYSLKIGKCKARFTVYERNGALFAKKTREDLETTILCLFDAYSELFAEIQTINKKIENLTGYDVIH